jgi:hypothetical protein
MFYFANSEIVVRMKKRKNGARSTRRKKSIFEKKRLRHLLGKRTILNSKAISRDGLTKY